MPIYEIVCPDCGNVARTLVLAGCRMPEEWPCSSCGGARGHPDLDVAPLPHPWETGHGEGCLCCGASAFSERSRQGGFDCTEAAPPDEESRT
jgi:hypothetical protein